MNMNYTLHTQLPIQQQQVQFGWNLRSLKIRWIRSMYQGTLVCTLSLCISSTTLDILSSFSFLLSCNIYFLSFQSFHNHAIFSQTPLSWMLHIILHSWILRVLYQQARFRSLEASFWNRYSNYYLASRWLMIGLFASFFAPPEGRIGVSCYTGEGCHLGGITGIPWPARKPDSGFM